MCCGCLIPSHYLLHYTCRYCRRGPWWLASLEPLEPGQGRYVLTEKIQQTGVDELRYWCFESGHILGHTVG